MKSAWPKGAVVIAAAVTGLILVRMNHEGDRANDPSTSTAVGLEAVLPAMDEGGLSEAPGNASQVNRPANRPHVTTTDNIEPPEGNAGEVLAALRPLAAAGDKHAALQIFLKTNECRQAIEAATKAAPNTVPSALVPANCADLTAQSYEEGARWLEAVADSGDEYARLLYAKSIRSIIGPPSEWLKHPEKVQAYKAKSMQYLNAAAANGSIEAWQSLSAVYETGVLAPPDNLRAYAYYRATQMADPNFAGPKHLELLRSRLSPGELHQAEALSRRIYEGKN